MNFKKFISGVSALAIAASAFAGMAVTANADNEPVTLNPTADTEIRRWGGKVEIVSTTAETLQPNNNATSFTSNNWRSSAIMKFAHVDGTISNATLKFYYDANSTNTDTLWVYSTSKADWNVDEVTWTSEMSGNASNATWTGTNTGSLSDGVSMSVYKGNSGWKEFDVTDILQQTEDGYSFMISTSGTKGGTIRSMEYNDAAYKPQLIITTTDKTPTTVTVNRYDKNNTRIDSEAISVTGVYVGDPYTVDSQYTANVYANDKKYVYDADNASNVTSISSLTSGTNTINLYFDALSKYTATVNALVDEEVKDTFTATAYTDEEAVVFYKKYIKEGNTYYVAAKNSDRPYYGKRLTVSNPTDNVTYTESDVTYATEGEDLTVGGKGYTGSEDTWYDSLGNARRLYGSSYATIDWTASKTANVTITIGGRNKAGSSSDRLSIYTSKDGVLTDTGVDTTDLGAGKYAEITATVTVPAGAKIVLNQDQTYNSNIEIDYVTLKANYETAAFSFGTIENIGDYNTIAVTVDGDTKTGEIPEDIKNYSGAILLAVVINEVPYNSAISAVLK